MKAKQRKARKARLKTLESKIAAAAGVQAKDDVEDEQEPEQPLNPWNTRRCKHAARILLASDVPPPEDREGCQLLLALKQHVGLLNYKLLQLAMQGLAEEEEEKRKNAPPWRHPCPFAEVQPCDLLTPSGADAEAIGEAKEYHLRHALELLPCERCRKADRNAEGLAGMRLGRLERSILTGAADAAARGERSQLLPDDPSPAQKVATFRAFGKLQRAGLVKYFYRRGRVIHCRRPAKLTRSDGTERHYDQEYEMAGGFHDVTLTPLGEAVVSRLRPALESGKSIRWGDLPHEALAAVRGDLPTLLVMAAGKFLATAYQWRWQEEYERRDTLRPTYALLRSIEAALPGLRQAHREELTAAFLDQLREFNIEALRGSILSLDEALAWLALVLDRGFCDPPAPAVAQDI
jgi:hypothetical protein